MTQYMTCPEGGTFFACTSTQNGFVGCCDTTNACTPQGCGDKSIVPAGFDNTAIGGKVWNNLHDGKCSAPDASFWSCNATKPTFWGCCSSNPCQNHGVCPGANLSAAYLDSNPADWAFFTQKNESKKSSNVGAIVGGAVGGFVVLVAVLAGIWWCVKLSRRRRDAREGPNQHVEVRYSAAPTLVPSEYFGSPTKTTTSNSPDPNQFSYNSTPSVSRPSPYHSGIPENFYWSNQQYPQHQAMSSPEPAWTGSTGYHPQQIAEIGGAPVYTQNEMPAE